MTNRWDRCGDETLVGVLAGEEIAVLRSYADGIVRLAEYELGRCTWIDGGTPGVGRLVPNGPISDRRLAAVVSDHLPEHLTDWEFAWHAVECLCDTIEAASRVAATLPTSDAVVVLEGMRDIDAWCRLIGDVLASLGAYRVDVKADDEEKVLLTETWLQSLLRDLLLQSSRSKHEPPLACGERRE